METLPIPTTETEVSPKAKRRIFSPQEKKRILDAADACVKPGELGALLRREGVYTSCFYQWKRAREQGVLSVLGKKRGPVADPPNPLEKEVIALKRALAKAEARAQRAEALVEVQKKIAELIGIQLPQKGEEP